MQVVPRLQLCCWLKHSSTSVEGNQKACEEREAGGEPRQANPVTALWAGGVRCPSGCLFDFFFFSFFVQPPTKASRPDAFLSLLLWEEEVRSLIPPANTLGCRAANEAALVDISAQPRGTVLARCRLRCILKNFQTSAEKRINISIKKGQVAARNVRPFIVKSDCPAHFPCSLLRSLMVTGNAVLLRRSGARVV